MTLLYVPQFLYLLNDSMYPLELQSRLNKNIFFYIFSYLSHQCWLMFAKISACHFEEDKTSHIMEACIGWDGVGRVERERERIIVRE